MPKKTRKRKTKSAEKPISLRPLVFDEAVSDLLQVKPENKGTNTSETDKDT
jgi:hypothetical protein